MLDNGLPEIVAKLIAPLVRAFTTEQLIGPDWVLTNTATEIVAKLIAPLVRAFTTDIGPDLGF
jgi:hypothetical protein